MKLVNLEALECPSCGAAVSWGQTHCQFCGTDLEWPEQATEPSAPGAMLTGAEEVVDYYSLLGIGRADGEPPTELEVREGALRAQQHAMMTPAVDKQAHAQMLERIEVGAWILSDERARREYDSMLISLRNGQFTQHHVANLHDLQQRARQELGLSVDDTPGDDLLQQGMGYLSLGMYREATQTLKRAIEVMPDSVDVHYNYGRALIEGDNPLMKTTHELRQAANSFAAVIQLDPSRTDAVAYEALCRGLMAREMGERAEARVQLRRAVATNPQLGVGWRALAAMALQDGNHNDVIDFCRRALLQDRSDEQAYTLLVASCWRAGQRDYARDAAGRIAALRGQGWNAQRVLKEIVG